MNTESSTSPLEKTYRDALQHVQKEAWVEAIALLTRVRAVNPQYKEARTYLAYAEGRQAFEQGDWDTAIVKFKALDRFRDTRTWLYQADQKMQAQSLYEDALVSSSGFEWQKAQETLRRAVNLDPEHQQAAKKLQQVTRHRSSKQHFDYGMRRFEKADWQKAIDIFEQIIKSNSAYPQLDEVKEKLAEAKRQLSLKELGRDGRSKRKIPFVTFAIALIIALGLCLVGGEFGKRFLPGVAQTPTGAVAAVSSTASEIAAEKTPTLNATPSPTSRIEASVAASQTPTPSPTNTATATASPTATPSFTSTSAPTETPTITPSPTVTPTSTPTAAPTETPPAATLTAVSTATPTPEVAPSPTETPSPPAATPTASPTEPSQAAATPQATATPTKPVPSAPSAGQGLSEAEVTPSPTPTAASTRFPPPILGSPPQGESISGETIFTWRWPEAPLPENHAFELRVWREHTSHDGAHDARLTTQDEVCQGGSSCSLSLPTQRVPNFRENGVYFWTAAVVQLEPYRRIGDEVPPHRVVFTR